MDKRLVILTPDDLATILAVLHYANCSRLAAIVETDVRCGTCKWWGDSASDTDDLHFCHAVGDDQDGPETAKVWGDYLIPGWLATKADHSCSMWEQKP